MMRRALAIVLGLALASAAWADAPLRSPRPEPRPPLTGSAGAASLPDRAIIITSAPGVKRSIRPRLRPGGVASPAGQSAAAPRPDRVILLTSLPGVKRSLRPRIRPQGMARPGPAVVRAAVPAPAPARAMRSAPQPVAPAGRQGAVCGDRRIIGQRISPVRGRLAGCRIAKPVRVTSIEGIRLSQPAVLDCRTAKALKSWIQKGARPAVGRLGGGIASMRVMASYACRTRNSQPGAKLSEHAKGKAIDIGAITLKNGMTLSVLKGWRDPVKGRILRRMHRAACGPFGTVLGPDANRFHRDHFHFDVARYRGRSYCR